MPSSVHIRFESEEKCRVPVAYHRELDRDVGRESQVAYCPHRAQEYEDPKNRRVKMYIQEGVYMTIYDTKQITLTDESLKLLR